MENERILFSVEFDEKVAEQNIQSLATELIKLKNAKKEIEDQNKKGKLSEEEYQKALFENEKQVKSLRDEQKDYQKQLELNNNVNKANANSYNSISAQLAVASKQLKEMAGTLKVNAKGNLELTEEFEAQRKKVTELKEAQLKFDSAIKDGRTNVGNYAGAQRLLSDSLENGKKSILAQGQSFLDLGKAFLSNPIGIAVTLFGLLYQALQKSQAGTEALQQITAAFGQVINLVFSLYVEPAIKLLSKGIVIIAEFASALSSAFSGGTANASKLQKELIGIEKALAKNEVENAKSLATQEKLKVIRDNESKDYEVRIKANKELGESERKRLKEAQDLEEAKLKVLKGQLTTLGETSDAEEKKKEILEQEKKIQDLNAESAGRETEEITNQVSLYKAKLAVQNEIAQSQLDLAIAKGVIKEGSAQELQAKKDLVKAKLEVELQGIEVGGQNEKSAKLKSQVEIANLDKDFNEKQAEKAKEAREKAKEDKDKFTEKQNRADIASLQNNLDIAENVKATKVATEIRNEKEKLKKLLEDDKLGDVEREKQVDASKAKIFKLEIDAEIAINDAKRTLNNEQTAQALAKVGLTVEERKQIENKANFDLSQLNIAIALKTQDKIVELEIEKQAKLKAIKESAGRETLTILQTEASETALILQQAQDLAGKFPIEENFAKIQDAIRENGVAQTALLEEQNVQKQESIRLQFDNGQITQGEFDALKAQQEQMGQDAINKIQSDGTDKAIADEDRKKNAQLALAQARMSGLAGVTDLLIGLVEKESSAGKALIVLQKTIAIAQIGLDLGKELGLIGSNPSFNADPTQILKIIAIASATARVAGVIKTVKDIKFADGDLLNIGAKQSGVFGGNSHANGGTKGYFSDGTRIEVEKDEAFAVINKRDSHLINSLGRINGISGKRFAMGGVTNFSMPSVKYENGGIIPLGDQTRAIQESRESLIMAISSLPNPLLVLSELDNAQKNISDAVAKSTIII